LDTATGPAAQQAENLQRIDAEHPTGNERHRHGAETDPVNGPEAAARAAYVLDVLAFALIIHPHGESPRRKLRAG